jgi:hypothetical protein
MREAPPKPLASHPVIVGQGVDITTQTVPLQVTSGGATLWHAIGSTVPWYVNHAIASRRALHRQLKRIG